MLGTVLDQLQALLPKRILIGIFVPLLLFVSGNAALLYWQHPAFQRLADRYFLESEQGAEPAYNGTLIFLALFLLSFVVSMLNSGARELLEGRYWPVWFSMGFMRRQWRAFDRRQKVIRELQIDRRLIEVDTSRWRQTLGEARAAAPTAQKCRYSPTSTAAIQIELLRDLRAAGKVVRHEELRVAAQLLIAELSNCKLDPAPPGFEKERDLLDADQSDFDRLTDYAHLRQVKEIVDLFNERQFSFPHDVLAPTAMGNIARSIDSYTESRYGLNFPVVWTRLQKTMQADEFYSTVQDAKTQVDFLVSCIWFGAASIVFWVPYFIFYGYGLAPFLLVGVLGPLILALLYWICLQSYRAFAALVRSAIDMYRLKLLQELHIPLPEGALEERRLWEAMNRQLGYGEAFEFSYDHGR